MNNDEAKYELEERITILTIDGGTTEDDAVRQARREIIERAKR